MPNWADENGRYWWTPPGGDWLSQLEIPHPPITVRKNCRCHFCTFERKQRKEIS